MKMNLNGVMLRAAVARWNYSKGSAELPCENPYPEMPGTYGLRRAWQYGYDHHMEVLNAASERRLADVALKAMSK